LPAAIVHGCCVRDVTNLGAGIRLNGMNIIPSEFGVSFDNFCMMRRCRMNWRDSDFVGVTTNHIHSGCGGALSSLLPSCPSVANLLIIDD
jgi:hypothetical protein